MIGINPVELLEGKLSRKAKSLVLEWATSQHAELIANWELARQQALLNKIDPLE